jgi:predicted N-acyltransferase
MGDRLLLVMAKRNNDYVAGAINFLGDKAIYGRYWGSKEEIPFLHYEVCYYQAIEFAINNGYRRVEAGAQGEHKIARGYQPVKIYSAHIFQDLALNSAVKGYVEREKQLLESIIQNQNSALPFRI